MGKNHLSKNNGKHQRHQHIPQNNRKGNSKINSNKLQQNSIRTQENYQYQKNKKHQKIEKPPQVLRERSELADLAKNPNPSSQQQTGTKKSSQQRKSPSKVTLEGKRPADLNKPKPNSQQHAKAKARKQQAKKRKLESTFKRSARERSISMFFTSLLVGQLVQVVGANTQSNINNKSNSKRPSLTEVEKNDLMRKVCANETTIPFNKPHKTTLVAENGVFKTKGCFNNNKVGCETELSNYYRGRDIKINSDKSLKINFNTFVEKRESNKIEYQKWMTIFQKECNFIFPTLNEEQRKYFSNMVFMIGKLKQMYGSEKLVQASHMGNCAEQTNAAMKSFLLEKMEKGFKLKIQHISLNAAHPTNKNNVQDHRFLLLDGNIPDKVIKNNPKGVEHLLSRIKSGFYCDPWNHLFENANGISDEERSFYSGHGKWHSAEVQTIELDFKQFQELPLAAQKLICNELNAVGFPAEFQPSACATFNPRVAERQEQKDNIRPELK